MKTDKIVILGGGSAGWMSAATLIKAFPNKDITIIESPNFPIIGVGESTLLGIKEWMRFLEIDEKDFFQFTDASYKLSIKFTDFYKKDHGSFHYPFGHPYMPNNRNPVTDWHLKKYFYPETTIKNFTDSLFPSSVLFENNKLTNFSRELEDFSLDRYASYHFDAVAFGQFLKTNYCIPRGVKVIPSDLSSYSVDENGIDKIILANSEEISADLFVDCTGFNSLLLGKALDVNFLSYSDILPNNSAWATKLPYKDKNNELELFTNCTAIENGWCWNIPLWSRIGAGYVYSDKFVDDKTALLEFKKYLCSEKMQVPRTSTEIESLEFRKINFSSGIYEKTFEKNVVAIGLAAAFVEPLESSGLFSVHEFLFKLIDILERREINQFDRDMYNVSIKDMYDNFAKFVALHYALSHRDDTDYWQHQQTKSFCDSLGDPFFPYVGRSDAFFDMAWRYMSEWGHPSDKLTAGIPYISTGMNVLCINQRRIKNLENRTGRNFLKEVDDHTRFIDAKKADWDRAATNMPSTVDFLYNMFYKK